jgi:hypothetical protein
MGHNDYDTLPNWYELSIGTSPYNPDTDADLILDSDELAITGTNPLLADTDGNGWTDYEDWSGQSLATSDPDNDGVDNASEITAGTNPRVADTDGDGLADGYELSTAGLYNPLLADTDGNGLSDYHQMAGVSPEAAAPSPDTDGDGLHDDQESQLGTHSSLQDSDGDGLTDGVEVTWGSSPLSQDTDGDGATDFQEHTHQTQPNQVDTDGDGLSDGLEMSLTSTGYSPLLADSNSDGINDYQAYTGQTPPPSTLDSDADGLPDADEISRGTSSSNPDSDGDTLQDGLETTWGSNPLIADTDNDQLPDGNEYALNTDPAHPDTDSDSLSDGYEVQLQLNPLQADTDSDGLADDHELLICQPPTNALVADTDQDGLTDFEEINAQWVFPRFSEALSPVMADTDGDAAADGWEVTAFFTDSDAGGLPDNIEALYGLNPAEPADDLGDLDGDGQTNIQEYQAGSALNGDFSANFDWDQDGMPTVWETAQGLDPLNYQDAGNDPDGDWSANLTEYQNSTQPQADDSGESGYTPSGEPLQSEGDGESWDEDWDNDGQSNLEELLEGESNPSTPNCTCGGADCGCTEAGHCSSICENTASCTCNGTECDCTHAGQCSGASSCSPDSECYCGGQDCSCIDNTGCSSACVVEEGCACGGSACSCTYAGCCGTACKPPNACSCAGDSCSCSDSYGCSSTCTSTSPCVCAVSGCACSDASGCSSGSCYTPPPCNCSYAGNGCTCATSSQCSGNCYTYPCECSPNYPEDCNCSSSSECTGQCENMDGPCQCGCTGYCYTDGDCNYDCMEPCECSGVDSNDCICSTKSDCFTTCEKYKVKKVTATDSNTKAGTRTSSTCLKMIADLVGSRSASLEASGQGPKGETQPEWSNLAGGTLTSTAGSTTASWSGRTDGKIKASAGPSYSEVRIELVPSAKTERIIFEKDTATVKDTLKNINGWLNKLNGAERSAGLTLSGEIKASTENVDYYNDGSKIGTKWLVEGSVSGSLGAVEISKEIPTSIPAIKVGAKIKIDALSLKCTASGSKDDSKSDNSFSLEGSVELGASITGTATAGIGIPEGVTIAELEAEATASVTGGGKFRCQSKGVYSSLTAKASPVKLAGKISWTAIVDIIVAEGEIEVGEALEYESPETKIYEFD